MLSSYGLGGRAGGGGVGGGRDCNLNSTPIVGGTNYSKTIIKIDELNCL